MLLLQLLILLFLGLEQCNHIQIFLVELLHEILEFVQRRFGQRIEVLDGREFSVYELDLPLEFLEIGSFGKKLLGKRYLCKDIILFGFKLFNSRKILKIKI